MRAFIACLASLVTATTAAQAAPIGMPTNLGTQPAPSSYVDGGLEGGGTDGFLTLGGRFEVGTRVAPDLWIHALVADGGLDELFSSGHGIYTRLRAGADLMSCGSTGVLCIFVGGDLGYEHTSWTGHEDPIFFAGPATGDAMDTTIEHDRMIGVGRVGLDIGGTVLRWRPSIEGSIADDGATAFTATQSIALRF
jgi:hypothetical protein